MNTKAVYTVRENNQDYYFFTHYAGGYSSPFATARTLLRMHDALNNDPYIPAPMYRSHKMPVIACDREKVVAAKGIPKNEIVNRRLTGEMEEMMEQRKVYACGTDNCSPCLPVEGIERHAVAMAPVIASGDVVGAIIFLSPDSIQAATASQTEVDLARAFALYLGELLGD